MSWIDVEIETPKVDGFYNVEIDTDDGVVVHSCWFEDGKWKFDNELVPGDPLFTSGWYCDVIKWQPLPLKS